MSGNAHHVRAERLLSRPTPQEIAGGDPSDLPVGRTVGYVVDP
jgi:hypothetical protein